MSDSADARDAFIDLLQRDKRYRPEAYRFIIASLDYAQNGLKMAAESTAERHITGQDLCRAACLYATKEYGLLAKKVLADMGINSTSDLGELVYNLIQIGQMNKNEKDSRADFDNVLDFATCFQHYRIGQVVTVNSLTS